MSTSRPRVVLADDDVLLRESLASLLDRSGLEVVGQAGDAAELMKLVGRERPDLAVVDIRMPPKFSTEGLEAGRVIQRDFPQTAVMVLSAHVEVDHAMDLLANGQRTGYLLKSRVTDITDFVDALKRVERGGSAIDPALVQELVAPRRDGDRLGGLTAREREVLALMAEGRSNTGIGQALWVTEGTVEKHVRSILIKLQLPETAEDHRRVLAVLAFLEGPAAGGATAGKPAHPRRIHRRTARRGPALAGQLAVSLDNAQLYADFRRIADEQATLRRVATLVAHGAPPGEVFAAVAEEVGRLVTATFAVLIRYEQQNLEVVGQWTTTTPGGPAPTSVGTWLPLGGRNVSTMVHQTGQPARIDYEEGSGVIGQVAGHDWGFRSSVGVPVSVEGRLWGVVIVAFADEEPLPSDIETRLAGFTELVATAIANAGAQAEVIASRARIVAAADQARRRIERDLHDGAQQRLVTLALQLRGAQATVPPELAELAVQLDRAAAGVAGALDELREIARGIHPAILADGGLRPALRTLARRSPIPVRVDVRLEVRPPEQVEVSAYYVVAEALTNAARHASASAVSVEAGVAGDVLRIAIDDDGAGGASFSGGTGLAGLKDRVEALGGRIFLDSPAGAGTSLRVELPLTSASTGVTSR